jgi:hypothetical protein
LTLTGLAEEERDDLPLVNACGRTFGSGARPVSGATNVTRDLLLGASRPRTAVVLRQVEAVETIIYLQEIRFPGRLDSLDPKLVRRT